MIFFPTANLVVFAVPKTGSTAFEQTFKRDISDALVISEDKKHSNVRQYEYREYDTQYGRSKQPVERMAILREPLERLHSWFRFRRGLDENNPNSTRNISFEKFIELTMLPEPPRCAKNVGDQWEFCIRKNSELGITHIFDVANLQPLDDFLQRRLGRGFPRQRLNTSKPGEMVLTKKVEKKLRSLRAQEFALYDTLIENGGHLETDINT